MQTLGQSVPLHIETGATTSPRKSIMPPLIAAIILATGGATDAVAIVATGSGILEDVGFSTYERFGVSGLFLAGLIYCAKKIEAIHKERIDEWRQRFEEQRKDNADLVKRIRELEDGRDDGK